MNNVDVSGHFPNVFRPDFETFCLALARKSCAAEKDNPWIIAGLPEARGKGILPLGRWTLTGGEDGNYGLVNNDDEPYELLTQAFADVHAGLYALRAQAAKLPRPQVGETRETVWRDCTAWYMGGADGEGPFAVIDTCTNLTQVVRLAGTRASDGVFAVSVDGRPVSTLRMNGGEAQGVSVPATFFTEGDHLLSVRRTDAGTSEARLTLIEISGSFLL